MTAFRPNSDFANPSDAQIHGPSERREHAQPRRSHRKHIPGTPTGTSSGHSHRSHPANSHYSGPLRDGVPIQGHGTAESGTSDSGVLRGRRWQKCPRPRARRRGGEGVPARAYFGGTKGKKKGNRRPGHRIGSRDSVVQEDSAVAPLMASEAPFAASCSDLVDRCAYRCVTLGSCPPNRYW